MQVVLGYSEPILEDGDFPPQFRDDLEKVNQAARSGADRVRALLMFSRKTRTNPKPLNLNRRIRQVHKLLERTIPKMIAIELVLSDGLPAINADATQIEQVLMNLSVNVRGAISERGKIVIATENVHILNESSIAHLGIKAGHYVLLGVSDTGKGMEKDTLEHIFEPFYTTKASGEGTGLGLAMVYGIVEQHRSHIRCYSRPSQGTIFKICFPALACEAKSGVPNARPPTHHGSETILLVDDEALIRELGARILSRAGYKVIQAPNGSEALALYESRGHEISLVILDLIMPQMGGKECLEELLKLNPNSKIVNASGHLPNGSTKETISDGVKGFINKLDDMRRVLEVVRSVLDSE